MPSIWTCLYLFGMKGTMRCLQTLRFENFHEEFNCYDDTYDWYEDNSKRYNVFIDIIKNFDPTRVNNNTLEKYYITIDISTTRKY